MKLIITTLIALSLFSCTNENKKTKPVNQEIKKDTLTKGAPRDAFFTEYFLELTTIDGETGLADYARGANKVTGKVIKQLYGSEGSEYYLFKLNQTLNFKDERKNLTTNYLIIGGRFSEHPLRKGAMYTTVNIAIVKDQSAINDSLIDFDKSIFVGMGEATEYKK